MPAHYEDKTRNTTDRRPAVNWYRLFGVDHNGGTYFYWSTKPGQYGAFYGPDFDAVWGTLTNKTTMLTENRVFIKDLEMVRKLESFGIMKPCGGCQPAEYNLWKEGLKS
jgi:hypothetical protein